MQDTHNLNLVRLGHTIENEVLAEAEFLIAFAYVITVLALVRVL